MDCKSRKLKFSILTLGCKVNQYESEALEKALSDKGCVSVDPRDIRGERLPPELAPDVCVINTCTVTQKAAMQSRQAIRRAIRANPDAVVVVTGCYAQTRPEEIAEIQGVHFIRGHSEKNAIADLIGSLPEKKTASPRIERCRTADFKVFQDMPETPVASRTRSFLKIQDGCDQFCTYCIVPHARGRSRSLAPERVLDKIRTIRQAGCREVVLTGIHLGAYGKDLEKESSLYELLVKIRDLDTIDRVRISSIEPNELTEDIVALAADWPGFCPHFHIPLQSGDDGVLERMHRPYTRDFFRRLVANIKEKLPHAAIGADCLIGFPGETEAAFEYTRRLIEELPVSYLHVFPFSARQGTPAWKFPGKVPDREIKGRCAIMRDIGNRKKKDFYESFVGQQLEALVEERRDPESDMLRGMSANYIPVSMQGPDRWKNTIRTVEVIEVTGEAGKLKVMGKATGHTANL